MRISKKSFWIASSFAGINMPLVPLKKGEPAIGRSRGGLTTKIHACVEGLGQLATCQLTSGQANDITQAAALLQGLKPDAVHADEAYDADALLNSIEAVNAKAVTPPRSRRKVQRSFGRIL